MSKKTPPRERPTGRVQLEGIREHYLEVFGQAPEQHGRRGALHAVGAQSWLLAHLTQMHAAGRADVDYHTLAVVSGCAALLTYARDDVRSLNALLMLDPGRRVAEATGFGYENIRFRDRNQVWRTIRQSIDAGLSLKAWGGGGAVIVAGYEDDPDGWDRHMFVTPDGDNIGGSWKGGQFITDWVDDARRCGTLTVGRHTESIVAQPKAQVAAQAIGNLVKWGKHPPDVITRTLRGIVLGLESIDAAAESCAKGDLPAERTGLLAIATAWTLRLSTAIYLERLADGDVLPTELAPHIRAASELYRDAYGAWEQFDALADEHEARYAPEENDYGPHYDEDEGEDPEWDDDWEDDDDWDEDADQELGGEGCDAGETFEPVDDRGYGDEADDLDEEEDGDYEWDDAGYDFFGRPVWSREHRETAAGLLRRWGQSEAAAIEELRKVWLALD